MIIDITGIELTPGNHWKDCLGNDEHCNEEGDSIECCCDECDYMMCCVSNECISCKDLDCTRMSERRLS